VRRRLSSDEAEAFDHVPDAVARSVRLVDVPFLTPGADAMTLGRTVLVRRGHGESRELLAHELVHAQQWADLGVVRFLARYLGAYLCNIARLRRHRPAYLAIPLEVEARERARRWRETQGRRRPQE
jgi:hypothetical protein